MVSKIMFKQKLYEVPPGRVNSNLLAMYLNSNTAIEIRNNDGDLVNELIDDECYVALAPQLDDAQHMYTSYSLSGPAKKVKKELLYTPFNARARFQAGCGSQNSPVILPNSLPQTKNTQSAMIPYRIVGKTEFGFPDDGIRGISGTICVTNPNSMTVEKMLRAENEELPSKIEMFAYSRPNWIKISTGKEDDDIVWKTLFTKSNAVRILYVTTEDHEQEYSRKAMENKKQLEAAKAEALFMKQQNEKYRNFSKSMETEVARLIECKVCLNYPEGKSVTCNASDGCGRAVCCETCYNLLVERAKEHFGDPSCPHCRAVWYFDTDTRISGMFKDLSAIIKTKPAELE